MPKTVPEYKMVKLKIPWDKDKHMAVYSRKNALLIARKLRPLVGKRVVLYGGGWGGDINVCRLNKVSIKKTTYYGEGNKIYHKPDDYYIDAYLRILSGYGTDDTLFGKKTFKPHLGSWKIAKLVKTGKRIPAS